VDHGSWRSATTAVCESLTQTSRESNFSLPRIPTIGDRARNSTSIQISLISALTSAGPFFFTTPATFVLPHTLITMSTPLSGTQDYHNSLFNHINHVHTQPKPKTATTYPTSYIDTIFNHPTAQCPPPRHSTALRSSTATSCPSTTKTIGRFRSSSAL
jgi:hypothetical protein